MKLQLDACGYQVVVTIKVRSTANSHILKGPTPFSIDDNVVDLIACPTIRLFPGELVDVPVCKDGTSNYIVVVQAEVNKPFTIVIHQATIMFAHGSFAVGVFRTNFGIHVSDDQKHVMLWNFGDCLLQLFVPVFLVLFVRFIGWDVTQNDCKLALFGVEACFHYPITDRFPFQQGVGLLLGDYKGDTTHMCVLMS